MSYGFQEESTRSYQSVDAPVFGQDLVKSRYWREEDDRYEVVRWMKCSDI